MSDAGGGIGHLGDLRLGHVYRVGEPDVGPHPTDALRICQRGHAESIDTERFFIDRLRDVSVQRDPVVAGEHRRLSHQVRCYRER